ncbi:MAG: hypothetical protein P8163_09065 [Candidatus Thiodiazotropha sp.]
MDKNNTLRAFLIVVMICVNGVALAKERTGTLMVHLSYNEGNYTIVDRWVVSDNFPIKSGNLAGNDALIFQLTDDMDREITRIKVKDPSIVRGPPLSDEEAVLMGFDSPHNIVVRKQGALILRFPFYDNIRYINLLTVNDNEADNSSASRSRSIQKMDLFDY